MITHSFNDGWRAGESKTGFASFMGGGTPHKEVTLPYDAVRDLDRSPDAVGSSHTGYFPGGFFEYTKSFDVPVDWESGAAFLEFEGVYRDAVVRVNGNVAAHRANGYAGFSVDLAPFLRYGDTNEINVKAWSHDDSRWYSGAGIYRDVWLHLSGPVYIEQDGAQVTTPEIEDALAVAEVAVRVRNSGRSTRTVRVSTTVTDGNNESVATSSTPITILPGSVEIARLRHYVSDPSLWSAESPSLYNLRAVLLHEDVQIDEHEVSFGIRRLQLDPVNGLRVNGEPVKLRGACVHHDNGPLGSAAIARAEERKVERLKAAGYNAIRGSHNPISRSLLDACDRVGVYVMDELSDVWVDPKTAFDHSVSFAEWWERDIESMVAKDFNHPSVIMYSIGNEIPEVGNPIGSSWGRHLAEKFRSLDGTRYITNAVNCLIAASDAFADERQDAQNGGDLNAMITSIGDRMSQLSATEGVTKRTEESFGVLDISGVNYGETRYDLDRELFPNRILVGSETFPGHLDVLWPMVRDNANVIGDFAWTGWDYLGEAGIGRQFYEDDTDKPVGIASGYPWLTAGCGTIDILGNRRPISYWREIVWGLRSAPYIAVQRPENHGRVPVVGPWSWLDSVSSWSWSADEGSPVSIEVYSDADEVELLVNGSSVGRAAIGTEKAFVARFETDYRPGTIEAVAYKDGQVQERTALSTAVGQTLISLRPDRPQIRAVHNDLAYVDIVLEDAAGSLANHHDRAVTITIEGPGELIALASAKPDSTERFDSDGCTTYDGRALAVVRPTGPGSITIRATAKGLSDATTTVDAT